MTSQQSPAPQRQAQPTPLRRLSRNVLIIGTVVAALAACGPVWVVRGGVVVAVAAATVSCLAAWRELAAARDAHAAEMLSSSRAHSASLSEERRHNASVVEVLAARAGRATAAIAGHQASIRELQARLAAVQQDQATLQADRTGLAEAKSALEAELRNREALVASLRQTVRTREAELAELGREETVQLSGIPRRVRQVAKVATARDADVLILDQQLRGSGHAGEEDAVQVAPNGGAVVLPNYEGERRVG